MSEKKQLNIGDKIAIKNRLGGNVLVEILRVTKTQAMGKRSPSDSYEYKFKRLYDGFWGIRPVKQGKWDTTEYSLVESIKE